MRLRLHHLGTGAAAILLLSACSLSKRSNPQITVTPIDHAPARSVSGACPLPVVYVEPLTNYRKIAIIEGYGAMGQDQDVIDAAQRAACETGADAVLVVSGISQEGINTNPQIGQQGADSLTRNSSDTAKLALSGILMKGEKPTLPGRAGFFLEEYAIVYTDRERRPAPDNRPSPSKPIQSPASYTER